MSKAVIQASILNNGTSLTIAGGATVEIRDATTGSLATLWEDRAGTIAESNPLVADSDGFFRVYANSGRYDITVTSEDGSQTFEDVIAFSGFFDFDDDEGYGFGAEAAGTSYSGVNKTIRVVSSSAAAIKIESTGGSGRPFSFVSDTLGNLSFYDETASIIRGNLNALGYMHFYADGTPISAVGPYHEVTQPSASASNRVLVVWHKATSGNNVFNEYYTESSATARGSIDYNRAGGVVRYNTTSDGTLKTVVGDVNLEKCKRIISDYAGACKSYHWNHDEAKNVQIGPIAQELHKVFEGAVSVGGWVTEEEKQEDGTVKKVERYRPWAVDKTAAVNHLVIVVADQQKQIEKHLIEISDLQKTLKNVINRLKKLENNPKE